MKSIQTSFFLCFIALLVSVNGKSQKAPLIGVQFGSNVSELHGAGVPVYTDNKVGLTAGSFINIPLNEAFSIETKLLYSSKGAQFQEGKTDYKLQIRYLQIPALAQMGFGSENLRIYGNAGPYLGLLMDAEKKGKIVRGTNPFTGKAQVEKIDENAEDRIKRLDFGLMGALGTQFPFYNGRMKIALSYGKSLPEIQTGEKELLNRQKKGPVQNSTILLSVGYGLRLAD